MTALLTLNTAHRASTVAWSAEASDYFAGMERVDFAFGVVPSTPDTDADIRAAVAKQDVAPTAYPAGSALHAVDWHGRVRIAARWEAWSRRQRAKIAATYPAKRRRVA